MVRAGMTISDAAHEWVREMNAYPQEMIETLMQAKPDDWHEVTMPRVCDRVYVCNLPDGCEDYDPNGEIENIVGDVYLINLEDGNTVELGADDFEVERDSILPMWDGCGVSRTQRMITLWMSWTASRRCLSAASGFTSMMNGGISSE